RTPSGTYDRWASTPLEAPDEWTRWLPIDRQTTCIRSRVRRHTAGGPARLGTGVTYSLADGPYLSTRLVISFPTRKGTIGGPGMRPSGVMIKGLSRGRSTYAGSLLYIIIFSYDD